MLMILLFIIGNLLNILKEQDNNTYYYSVFHTMVDQFFRTLFVENMHSQTHQLGERQRIIFLLNFSIIFDYS